MLILFAFAALPFVYFAYHLIRIALEDERRVARRQYTVIGEYCLDDTWTRHEAHTTPSGEVEYTRPMERTK